MIRGAFNTFRDPAPQWPHTPLIPSHIPGLDGVFLKYEGGHITGSFKDRIMRLTVAQALERGATGAVVPSSGNAAVAAAAACAAIGMPLLAIVPSGTPEERTVPILARGAAVIRAGAEPSESYRCADRLVEQLGLFPLYSTFASPWAEWACRGIGVEIYQQLGCAPATLLAPISAGPVLVGAAHGVAEAASTTPRLVAVQAQGCCPVVEAFGAGRDDVRPWSGPVNTLATAIVDRLQGYPQDGTLTLRMLRNSGGLAAAVSDEELQQAREALLRCDGLDVELSAAAGVALLKRGEHSFPEPIVCLLTASGFKHTYSGSSMPPPPLRASTGAGRGQSMCSGPVGRLHQPDIVPITRGEIQSECTQPMDTIQVPCRNSLDSPAADVGRGTATKSLGLFSET
jgi:threonine synthase